MTKKVVTREEYDALFQSICRLTDRIEALEKLAFPDCQWGWIGQKKEWYCANCHKVSTWVSPNSPPEMCLGRVPSS